MLRRTILCSCLLMSVASTAKAELVTINTGVVGVFASAGSIFYQQEIDSPPELTPRIGTVSVHAEAQGQDYDAFEGRPLTVTASATAMSTIRSPGAEGLSIDFDTRTTELLAHHGGGTYGEAFPHAYTSITFTLNDYAHMKLEYQGPEAYSDGTAQSSLQGMGRTWFEASRNPYASDYEAYALYELFLQPGEYTANLESFGGAGYWINEGSSIGSLSLEITPVPLPPAVWLLVSGIAAVGTSFRRKAN